MATETEGKRRFSVVGSKRALSFKRRRGVVSNTMTVRCVKTHLYSGQLALKSAIKIANLIFFLNTSIDFVFASSLPVILILFALAT